MSAVRKIIDEAPLRGIHLHLEGDQLVITGDANEQFVRWARKHKPEIVAELAPKPIRSGLRFSREDDLLDQARSGIGGTLDEVREVLRYDLADLFNGALPIEAARHYYRHNNGRNYA